jgi:hypothetical protein
MTCPTPTLACCHAPILRRGPGDDGAYGLFPGLVHLLDWGCNLWSLCNFRTPEGMMCGWDPHTCCGRHKLFAKDRH